ncbi:MAG: MurR/RpiR family transcriptional regulator [Spirochaetales bacterium]|nr:MurR/RpiR family transcriptional regulator [Spirochaetales bacterium]
MQVSGGIILIKNILDDLPTAEKKVAEYIIKNPKKIPQIKITELAEKSGGSAAGVVRLCKRLGIEGYRDLQLRINLDVNKNFHEEDFSKLVPGLPDDVIMRSIIKNNQKGLGELLEVMNPDLAVRTVDAIDEASHVDIYGVGASGIVALDLYQKLQRIGKGCSYNPDPHMQITSACGLAPGQLVFAISYSGETSEVVKATREGKESGARVVTLCRFGKTTLSELGDIKLYVPASEPLIREGAMASRIAQLTVIDILFSILVYRDLDSAVNHLRRTLDAVKGRTSKN